MEVTMNRNSCLAALFSKAKEKGIDQEMLRETIAPGIIKKRLSKASEIEIVRVIAHIEGKAAQKVKKVYRIHHRKVTPPSLPLPQGEVTPSTTNTHPRQERWGSGLWKYESSISGLKKEICDMAEERWGDGYVIPLNLWLKNKYGVEHWRFLDVTNAKKAKIGLTIMKKRDEENTGRLKYKYCEKSIECKAFMKSKGGAAFSLIY
jgi:hypothetical protein